MNNNYSYSVSDFQLATEKKNTHKLNWSIRGNIFISGKHTTVIADTIEEESWGSHNHQLYHYIDYTFRTRVMKNQMKVYNYRNGETIAVFHTGLISRESKQSLYLLCKPNSHAKKNPYWAVPHEHVDDTSKWLMTKDELMHNYAISERDLPKKVEYIKRRNMNNTYNKRCRCDFNWYKIFSYGLSQKAKKTITEEIKRNGCEIETKKLRYLLSDAFTNAVKQTIQKARNSNKYVVPGLFMDFDNQDYWVSLMMHINVKYGKKDHKFVIVMDKNYYKNEYEFVDVLSLKQGYYNGRYIQRLPEFWKPKSKYVSPQIKPKEESLINNDSESKKAELNIKDLSDLTPASSASSASLASCQSDKTVETNVSMFSKSQTPPVSKISISPNSAPISPSLSVKPVESPIPFSLDNSPSLSNENKCTHNNNNGLVEFNQQGCHIVTLPSLQYNPFTSQLEVCNTTTFSSGKYVSELSTFSSGTYVSKMYKLQGKQIISQHSGIVNDVLSQ